MSTKPCPATAVIDGEPYLCNLPRGHAIAHGAATTSVVWTGDEKRWWRLDATTTTFLAFALAALIGFAISVCAG